MDRPSVLVLFDIDGTLLSPKGCGRAAMEAALWEVFGQTGAIDRIRFDGKTDWQILVEALGLDAQEVAQCLPVFERAMRDHLVRIIGKHAVEPCPGAPALVAALAAEPRAVPGILTGNLSLTAPVKLRAAGFDPAQFRVSVYGSDAPWRHLLPALAAERAHALTGVRFGGKQVVIVGDTPNDVACGRGVGAKSIAVLTGAGGRADLDAAQPDYLFDDLRDAEVVMAAIFS
ncbi:MAG: HAD hydrolase-like protein [Anaerolineae bacterium]|nr:HAD hydrolase-like protein [Anaerolineae bacterium]